MVERTELYALQRDGRVQEKRGDGMSEAIAFMAGMVAMGIVWFINDNSPNTSPYARGYVEGYKDAMKKHKKKEATE